METLVRTPAGAAPPTHADLRPALDEGCGRRALRDQIAQLERRLADMPPPFAAGARRGGGPDLLSLGELERVRDGLVDALRGAQARAAAQAHDQARARARVEAMLADPAAHRWERVQRAELGETGCGAYHVRPRLGLVGMLAGWWEVKLSSGCPLP